MPQLRLGALGLTALLVSACQPTNLYVAHDTVVGVNAAVNTERTNGHLLIGYDRNFVTVIPKSVPTADGGKEAMSALACSDIEVEGIFLSKFVESLATGQAAIALAKQRAEDPESESLDPIFDCYEKNASSSEQ